MNGTWILSDKRQHHHFVHENMPGMFTEFEPGIDRRSRRTRQALHQALIHLIIERGYDEITVADIAEAADTGRSTFYVHFTDKDDLLRSAGSYLKQVLIKEHETLATSSGRPEDRMLGFSQFMTAHLYEQRVIFHALMRGQGGPIFLEMIRDVLCEIVRNALPADSEGDALDREVAVQFIVGGYITVVTWWLRSGARQDPSAVEAAFRKIASSGLSY
jgi:AcrR family transcriptional regulator